MTSGDVDIGDAIDVVRASGTSICAVYRLRKQRATVRHKRGDLAYMHGAHSEPRSTTLLAFPQAQDDLAIKKGHAYRARGCRAS